MENMDRLFWGTRTINNYPKPRTIKLGTVGSDICFYGMLHFSVSETLSTARKFVTPSGFNLSMVGFKELRSETSGPSF